MARALLLILALGLAAPAAAQEAGAPAGAISTEATVGTDAAIERRIEGILAELDGFGAVGVDVSEGIVRLTGEVLDAAAVDRLDEIANRVEGVVAVENDVAESTAVAERLDPVIERFGDRLAEFWARAPLLMVALLAGLVVAAAGWLLARWEAPWRRLAPNAFIADIYRMVLRLAFVAAGVVVALDILGATAVLAGLFGAVGIVGIAVGFAVRDTVENFIASIMLSLRQPFRPNDFVDIEGSMGSVVRLTSRATILIDLDGNHLRLPNAVVFKARILNYTRNPHRRFAFDLGIDPGDDLAAAKRIGVETLRGLDFTLDDPAPAAWIQEAGDSTITMTFSGWLDQRNADWIAARGEALRVVMAALTRADIGLPEPTYRLNLAGGALPVVDLPDRAGRSGRLVVEEVDADELDAPARQAPPPVHEKIRPDPTIGRMVAEERREKPGDDLLSPAAPEE
jgi:small-conductance mechanosensitive channel